MRRVHLSKVLVIYFYTPMVLLQGFHWWISNHDVLVGKNQVAYAENVFLRDPEFISLWQKSENYALTDNDLVLSKMTGVVAWHTYMGTYWGKMYDAWTNNVVCTTAAAKSIYNVFILWSYLYFSLWSAVGRVDTAYLIDASSWVSGDLEAQGANYTETYKTANTFTINKYVTYWSWLLAGCRFTMQRIDSAWTYTSWPTLDGVAVWIWKTLNYYKCLTHKGVLSYSDATNNTLNASQYYSGWYIEGGYLDAKEFHISWLSTDGVWMFVPSGEWKELIMRSRVACWPDEQEVFAYWRANWLNDWFTELRTRQYGMDTMGSYNNLAFFICKNKLWSWGQLFSGLPRAHTAETVKNYNNDTIDEIGMVKVENETSTGDSWLYYSWRSDGVCWVDRIDLSKINNPDTYRSEGTVYTQKFDFWHSKLYIEKVKMRAYTTTGQTVKIYSSVDWWAFTLKETLSNTNPKKYFVLWGNEECYSIQWKFVLETDDESATPKIYAFDFTPKVWAND